jgi:GTPase-associated protein 1, N-terminal domain type 2
MSFELVYTSAPKTLEGPGYGVVAKSEGLPDHLEKLMRQLNRYDFELSPTNGAAAAAPVLFSHTLLRDHSVLWHVLSRVAPAGCDFTQRAVFLAHHVAVTSDELGTATVAELLQEPRLFQSEWDGYVGMLPARSIPARPQRRANADSWELVAGDQDWASVWVEMWRAQKGRASFLILPGETDVRPLFADALSLLPASEANQVAFITHLNADRAGVHFDWIGLTAGSEMARSILNRFPDRSLDMTVPSGSAPASPFPSGRAATLPGSEAPAPVRRSVTRGRDARDADAAWKADRRQFPEIEPQKTRPDYANVAPPPPPPATFSKQNAIVMLAVGLVASALALGGFAAWQTWKQPLSDQDHPNAIKGAENEGTGGTANAGSNVSQAGNSSGSNQTNGSKTPLADSPRKRRIVHLDRWLWYERSEDQSSDDWYGIAKLKLAANARIKDLLLASELGFETSPLGDDPGDGIRIHKKGHNNRGSWVAFRVKDQALQIRRSPELPEKFEDLLELAVLDIDSPEESVRVMLTPVLPAVQLSEVKIEQVEKINLNTLFQAIHDAEGPLDPTLRIDGLSLSILTRMNIPWRFNDDPSATTKLGTELNLSFSIDDDGESFPATLTVDTDFGLTGKFHYPIDAKLTIISPAKGATGSLPLREDQKPQKEAKPKGRRKQNDLDRKIPAADKTKPKKNGPAREPDKSEPSASNSRDSDKLLNEFFRRFGRVHGSVVVKVKSGASSEDVELVRFGDVPENQGR